MNKILSPPPGFDFPAADSLVRANWRAIYIEPMLGSGERICVGIVVANQGALEVAQVPALTRLRCLYGDTVDGILSSSELVLNDLRQHLGSEGPRGLDTWQSPMSGFLAGEIHEGAGATLNEIIRGALTMSASLVEQLAETEEDDVSAGFTTPRLERLIKEKVTELRPGLSDKFTVKIRRAQNQRPVTIGFVGSALATNFGVLFPMNISANVRDIKSKLWDLANLREDTSRGTLFSSTIHRYEMHIYRPNEDEPVFSDRQLKSIEEAANELEAEADDMDVICRATPRIEEIVDRIVTAEAA